MNSKGFILLSLAFILLSLSVSAQNVNVQTAKLVAEKFSLNHIPSGTKGESASLQMHSFRTNANDTLLYIFNVNKNGFVIIAGDSSVVPVLAYSDESNIPDGPQSPEFEYWINNLSNQISSVKKHKQPTLTAEWQNIVTGKMSKGSSKAVNPLVTAKWDQGKYYNYYCPLHPSGSDGRCFTGCVATAMSQLMYYYKFPAKGTGSHSYYHPYYGMISSDFSSVTFDWATMTNTANSNSYDAISKLIFNCGVSVDMYYTPTNSTSNYDNAVYALTHYFNYSIRMKYVHKSDYNSNIIWNNVLMENLDRGIPILYRGNDSAYGGHAWICDGYKDSCYFHMNWGWSGNGNGYFYLTDLQATTIYNFTSDQGAVLDVVPYDFPYCYNKVISNYLFSTLEDGSGYSNYWNNTNCTWLLVDTSNNRINLNFSSFATEENHDFLKIYDGGDSTAPLIGSYSGHNLPPAILSTGNKLFLHFTSDSINQDDGFSAVYFTKTSGIENIVNNKIFALFPNPAHDKITINSSLNESIVLSVYDMTGRSVLQKSIRCGSNEWDISGLSQGIYLIKNEGDKILIQQKLIKN